MYNVVMTNNQTNETTTKVTDLKQAVLMAGNVLLFGGYSIQVYSITGDRCVYENDCGFVNGYGEHFQDYVNDYYNAI